ncbi:hypothetical protein EV426DRAFT_640757 [Tirmania nivea]|nr:hypothetical protein EV426DRAFT_640757 [Tirmania nivea]
MPPKPGARGGKALQTAAAPPAASADTIALFCLLDGQISEHAFLVDISRAQTISALKELILWKVAIPVLVQDDSETDDETPQSRPVDAKKLHTMQKISKAFPEEPLEDHIHVFIEASKQVVPITTPNLEKDEGIKRKLDALACSLWIGPASPASTMARAGLDQTELGRGLA